MSFPTLGISAGTGMAGLCRDRGPFEERVYRFSPYGVPVRYALTEIGGVPAVFTSRHTAVGPPESSAAHLMPEPVIDFLAREIGIRKVFATSAVGGIGNRITDLHVGTLVCPHDYRDFTGGLHTLSRPGVFDHLEVFHRAPAQPFCPELRRLLCQTPGIQNGAKLAIPVKGNRYETDCEIGDLTTLGYDLVGMPTTVPEAICAREAAIHYAVVCCVTDLPGREHVSADAIVRVMHEQQELIYTAFAHAAQQLAGLESPWPCDCENDPSVYSLID